MAEIDRINQKLREKEREIRTLQEEMQKLYKKMERQHRQNMDEYEKKLQEKLRASDKAHQERCDRELRALKAALMEKMSESERTIAARYMDLQKQAQQAQVETEKRLRELEEYAEHIKVKGDQREEQAKKSALHFLNEAKDEQEKVNNLPHEKFFPKKLSIYTKSMRNAAAVYKQGLYEAAGAMAVSVRASLERFFMDIKGEQSRWNYEFEELERECEQLDKALLNIQEEWKMLPRTSTLHGERLDADIDFWMEGWYQEVKEQLKGFEEENTKVRNAGEDTSAYLKLPDAMDITEIRKRQGVLEQRMKELEIQQRVSSSKRRACAQRVDWVRQILEYMVEVKTLCFDEEASGLQEAEEARKKKSFFQTYNRIVQNDVENTGDHHGWYRMVFHGYSGVELQITLLPIQREYETVNTIQYHLFQGNHNLMEEGLILSTRQDIFRAIGQETIPVINTNDPEQLRLMQTSPQKIYRQWMQEMKKERRIVSI